MFRSSRRAEERRSAAEHARLILETANDAFVGMDVRGYVIDWNAAAERTFGWSRDEAIGRELAELIIPTRFHKAHRRGLRHYLETGEGPVLFNTLELPAVRRSGDEFPVQLTIWPSEVHGEQRFNAFVRDVSEQARLRAHLSLLQRVTAAANAAPDAESVMRTAIEEVTTLTGWPVGHAYELDETGAVLRPTSWWSSRARRYASFVELTSATEFAAGRGLPGQAAGARAPAWLPNLAEAENFPRRDTALEAGLAAGMAFPVLIGDRSVAVLEFFAEEPTPPDEELMGLMHNIGTQIGRVYERIGHRTQLQASLDFRERMTSVVSHELRSPLSAVRAFAKMLGEDWQVLSDDEKLEMVGAIERQSSRLLRLVGDLLTMSRLDGGAVEPHLRPVDVAAAAEQVVGDLGLREVHVEVPTGTTAFVDGGHLERMLTNYLVNAVKYGAPPVVVEARGDGDELVVCVVDHGPGVADELKGRLFTRFAGGPLDEDSTGLGLSIVAGLAQVNGGEAWYEPNEPTGARFNVRLPAARSEART